MKKLLFVGVLFTGQVFSAQLIDLKMESPERLKAFFNQKQIATQPDLVLKEVNRYVDARKNMHIRFQQFYQTYPILHATTLIHLPPSQAKSHKLVDILNNPTTSFTMNGKLYQKLSSDLKSASKAFNSDNHDKVRSTAQKAFLRDIHADKAPTFSSETTSEIIFVDKNQKAHFAYQVSFYSPISKQTALPAKPVFIIDAQTQKIYQHWDNIKTVKAPYQYVWGGGFGGNEKTGALIYDGKPGALAAFKVKRADGVCYMENGQAEVIDNTTGQVVSYPCPYQNLEYNKTYWSGNFDTVNHGFSPANDALYNAQVVQRMYKEWYGVPVLIEENGQEGILQLVVHVPKFDNAFWDGDKMTFGDGDLLFPLTSLGIAAHEVSHGFTQQHANLIYEGQSGGMNESFSDMAAMAAEYFTKESNSWTIGEEIFKFTGEAMRYMDRPSRDCYGKEPGTFCSIDSAEQYYDGLDVHFTSGVYNHFFYLLATKPGWDPQKAFEVMLHANASYWVSDTQYADGAACVVKAADDLDYSTEDVKEAFAQVGIDVKEPCVNSNNFH